MNKPIQTRISRVSGFAKSGPWQFCWPSRRAIARILTTYAIACAGGAVAQILEVPLAWMLGPFFTCCAISAFGVKFESVPFGRAFAQVAIGLSVGLRFTPATLAATVSLMPVMLVAAVYVVFYTAMASLLYRPLAGVSLSTAFFSTAAGGVADTAVVAARFGGDAVSVGLVHCLRVSCTVATVPFLVFAHGNPGTGIMMSTANVGNYFALSLVFVAAIPVLLLFKRLNFPNPWMVGPMLLGIAIGASGIVTIGVPGLVIIVAQLLLGTWLGCQFRREIWSTFPRVAIAGTLVAFLIIGAASAGAWVLSFSTGLPLSISILALAPAGMPEMVLTAKAMHLEEGTVTAFHIVRILIVCTTISVVFRFYRFLTGYMRTNPLNRGENN